MNKFFKPLLSPTMPNKDAAKVGIDMEKEESLVHGTEASSRSNNGHQATIGNRNLRTEDADALMFPHHPEHAPSPVICGADQINQRKGDDQMLSGEAWGDRVIELMYPKRA